VIGACKMRTLDCTEAAWLRRVRRNGLACRSCHLKIDTWKACLRRDTPNAHISGALVAQALHTPFPS
jgi:hypothetical protein